MQTFLPCDSFRESVAKLDYKRLGKQRVEAYQLLLALQYPWAIDVWKRKNPGKEFKPRFYNHPCVKMWKGYEFALATYMNCAILEWKKRGYKNTMPLNLEKKKLVYPWWFGNPAFHRSHRSRLLSKDWDYYAEFWPNERDDLPYLWPTEDRKFVVIR